MFSRFIENRLVSIEGYPIGSVADGMGVHLKALFWIINLSSSWVRPQLPSV
jgi:hypothetical protein